MSIGGASWLVPRIGRFRQAWPDIDLRIDASEGLADFRRADCRETVWKNADLQGARFEEARLNYADMAYAKLDAAKFQSADLSWASVHGASTQGTRLSGASTKGLREDDKKRLAGERFETPPMPTAAGGAP